MIAEDLRRLIQRHDRFLFDLDGTLVDSSRCHERAFLKTLDAHRPDLLTCFEYEKHKGRNTESVFADLGVECQSERLLLTSAKQHHYSQEVVSGNVDLFPGARDLLPQA